MAPCMRVSPSAQTTTLPPWPCAVASALTVAPEGMEVTTVEYKINFLQAHQGGELHGIGRVVRGGKRIIVTTAEVVHLSDGGVRSDCALMQQTLVPVPRNY